MTKRGRRNAPFRKGDAMEVVIEEIINWHHSDYKDKLVGRHRIKAATKEEAFRKMYGMRRSARYDSCRRYEFEDRSLEPEYQDWKDRNETIEMYYGGGVVD